VKRTWLVWGFLMALSLASPAPASAHLATFGSWETTEEYLKVLFPDATRFMVKEVKYSPEQVAQIEKDLGFSLYPEDTKPTFYIAVRGEGKTQKLLGVALFVDPRLNPKALDGATMRLEIGVGVDSKGRISAVRVFDYRGDLALTRPAFLSQFNGMKLGDTFKLGEKLKAASDESVESQLVANAAHEVLYLMKMSLGKK